MQMKGAIMPSLIELTSEIVTAHASTVELTSDELLVEIQKVYAILKSLEDGGAITVSVPLDEGQTTAPVMSAKKSIQKNQVVCLICGKDGFKTLTRHLKQVHGMSASAYRKQFGIPAGTPLVAKAYSESRRESAVKNNLSEKLSKGREAYQAAQRESKATTMKTKQTTAKKATLK